MLNSSNNIGKKNIFVKVLTAIILFVSVLSCVGLISYSENVSSGLADNIIRLHVLANSDSPEDQQLKRDVRDVVINFMKDKLKNVKDVETTKRIIEENSEAIKQVALSEIRRQNKDYDVTVMFGKYPFPTKVYGDISLPTGNYQALRVVIGNGEGQNWWCVLFPPLCFVDATHGTVPDSVKDDLKEVLSEEEYYLITAQDEGDDIEIEIKFKIVEMFQKSKIKIASAMNKIFQ
ncbi:MAG TPA: stage II sporulation protein R [Hungateiclostridium thermocellum]|uniref:Stage II sporulation protein R n=1 Tax=Acetivibrio thermocellus (strain ATCC 27405 / DSM 1237 / JCM 9322 / NBRC 103400 / NCIMB 10682 / NRRL B-4536 / VPI 7372) TaxID=203119 RepID=A3DGR0_ACET2|nr:stage II sporulation protein R [Acetivibrio thermocellus]ABN53139.1 stage II sporulation protein R [Acetivibrio thermocellus ATCC 27405]HBW27100.1 stage II sporulation protein R [Acetivibrio thermocellus]